MRARFDGVSLPGQQKCPKSNSQFSEIIFNLDPVNASPMLKNFLAVAFRNFMRQRLYSLINVLGLAAGLVCTLFIYLWVRDEWSKDKFHQDGEKIFQVLANLEFNKGEI